MAMLNNQRVYDYQYLVGGFKPYWNIFYKSVGKDDIPTFIMESQKCSKPPTRITARI